MLHQKSQSQRGSKRGVRAPPAGKVAKATSDLHKLSSWVSGVIRALWLSLTYVIVKSFIGLQGIIAPNYRTASWNQVPEGSVCPSFQKWPTEQLMQVSQDEEVSGEQREKCEGRAGNNVCLQQEHTGRVHWPEAISDRVFEASIELLSH